MILIVDDHDDTRNVLVRLFKLDGYETVNARTGAEAWSYLDSCIPSLVFTDYHMPELDGLSLVAQIRRSPRLSRVPIIMYTGYDMVKQKALEAGVDAFILKAALDWAEVRKEIVRLVGPGRPQYPVPEADRLTRLA